MSIGKIDQPATASSPGLSPAVEVHPSEAAEFLDAEAREILDHPEPADDLPEPEVIPLELAGRWIAWSPDGLRIVGHGTTPSEAREVAGVPTGAVQRAPTPAKLRAEHAGPAIS